MKTSIIFLISLTILMTSCSYDQDDNLSIPSLSTIDIIREDSDLFEHIEMIVNNEDRPDKNIACIDFIYPLTIYVFDSNDQYVSVSTLFNDHQFSLLLASLDYQYSISVSFPITGTYQSGESLIINTKEELKIAIDNCRNEELLFECASLLENCVFKIGYSYDYENTYLGNVFEGSNGLTILWIDDYLYSGSWSPLIIADELHININLVNAPNDISNFFNYDWNVSYIDENSLKLTNGEKELILNQRCDSEYDYCKSFVFEECTNENSNSTSEFLLNEYSPCIFETLELNNELEIAYFETEEDALNTSNPIPSDIPYNSIQINQTIYVRISDIENNTWYNIQITLSSISC